MFERAGDRVLVLPSSGGLAATQTVISPLRKRAADEPPHLWSAGTLFDVANLVSDAMRDIERRDGPFLESGGLKFNASFILGGQIRGEDMRLFQQWLAGTRKVFRELPPLEWSAQASPAPGQGAPKPGPA